MKKLVLIFVSILFPAMLSAQDKVQIKVNAPSPSAVVQQELGNATVKIDYSRPFARGRKIFGELVPFNQIWRTGASNCTKLITTEEVVLGDATLKAGSYSLFTIPTKDEWTIIINTDITLHGDTGYDEKKDVFRFKVPSEQIQSYYENFTIEINDINTKGEGFLKIIWENTMVRIPLKSTVDAKTMQLIDTYLVKQKSDDAKLLYQAATFYSATNRDTKQAITWLLQAEKLDGDSFNYPNLRQKLAEEIKDYSNAIDAAKKAVAIAERKNLKGIDKLKMKIKEWESLMKDRK